MRMSEQEYDELLKRQGKTPEKKSKTKYCNRRPKVDGILFDSQLEADKYGEFKLQLKTGEIAGFCLQPIFVLQEGFAGTHPITYRADFVIFRVDGTFEILDMKGMETEVFKLKYKQFKAKFPRLRLIVEKRDGTRTVDEFEGQEDFA